jgi:ketose-bisphosphate aldolase
MQQAFEKGTVIPAFNVPYLPMMEPLVRALRDTKSFGLIEVARLEWEKFQARSLEAIRETYESCKDKRYTRLHLDHIPVIDEDNQPVDFTAIIRRAIDLGFDSVMLDGSRLSLINNIEKTKRIADMAHAAGIPLEAELGAVVGHEAGPIPDYEELFASGKGFTDIHEAEQFVRETGVDWLSIAFGNVHGAISQAQRSQKKISARLNIDHLTKIRQAVGIPLVLHGGSNIPEQYVRDAIRHGICKINIGTEVRQTYEKTLPTSQSAAQDAVYTHACRILREVLQIDGKADLFQTSKAKTVSSINLKEESPMKTGKTTFAVLFGNRGFFPASLQSSAREEILGELKKLGHETLVMDPQATPHGAVETIQDGEKFARFLHDQRGRFGGVIICLPNFGDEMGAVQAVREANVPIFIQAYPDELGKMAPACRRDSFCGKFSIMDVFRQYDVKFTSLQPHVVHPASKDFAANIEYFDRVCRVVNGIRNLRIGMIGARTTPFKTVRIDEITLQHHGITVETFDLASIIKQATSLSPQSAKVKDMGQQLKKNLHFDQVPESSFVNLCRLGVALDELIETHNLGAVALRCWTEMQEQLGVSPCVLIGLFCERGIPMACEVDVGNAVMMAALQHATGKPVTILDWNNNYADDPDKCILFHCGNVPASMLTSRGQVIEHAILVNAVGPNCSFGCHNNRLKAFPMTFGSLLTEAGKVKLYVGQGQMTSDAIPADFFGNAGVAQIPNLQQVLWSIGNQGHRHHVSLGLDHVAAPMAEAFEKYLNCEVTRF